MPLLHLEPLSRQVNKSDVLAFLEQVGGVERRRIGRIELHGKQATIEIPDGWETRLVNALDGQLLRDRRVRVWASGSIASPAGEEDPFERLARVVEWESQAEAQEVAERARRLSPAKAEHSGNSLVDMEIVDEDTGLGGRFLVQ
ncbi:MAG: DbpA RNA binding domain-containing protein, partial [Planctomycetota bacterium]|nr:DbpA RNA binding domain-containing protein [Planctomycetota bacterium]